MAAIITVLVVLSGVQEVGEAIAVEEGEREAAGRTGLVLPFTLVQGVATRVLGTDDGGEVGPPGTAAGRGHPQRRGGRAAVRPVWEGLVGQLVPGAQSLSVRQWALVLTERIGSPSARELGAVRCEDRVSATSLRG